jgi:hypothetical protein
MSLRAPRGATACVPARSAEQYACPGDDLLTKARVGKRYRSNARTIYGRAPPSASEHDGKSYIHAGLIAGGARGLGPNPRWHERW